MSPLRRWAAGMRDIRRVTVLGVGLLGAPVAINLRRRGFDVTVWNRTAAKAQALAVEGCRPCAELREAVADADAVITLLADGPVTEGILVTQGALAAMPQQALLVQAGTVGMAATQRIATEAAAAGIRIIDAPVSGSGASAERGDLVVLAGGDRSDRAVADPLFAAMGRRTVWAGGVGDGMRLKLVIQTWLLTLVEALAETIALAESSSLDPALFLDAISGGPLDVAYAHLKGRAMRDRDFAPAFSLTLAAKDARLARELAGHSSGRLAPILDLVIDRAGAVIAAGHGGDDMAAIFHATGRPSR